MNRDAIVALDRELVWHPYTAHDDWVKHDPIVVASAEGAWLVDVDGKRYLDGNSSWWVSGLGHRHPRLLRAMREQAERLDHCALGGITHEPAVLLAKELCAVAPAGLKHVFYTDNGSTAIEAAVRMAAQAAGPRTKFVALTDAFHGDTLAAASLGGMDVFRRAVGDLAFECVHLAPNDVSAIDSSIAAVFVEPIVQAAAGMRIHDPAYLKSLRAVCDAHDVLLVADEVFTGYGRTGPMWACDHAGIAPDILCIGKAFSSIVPMGAVLANDRVFDAFRHGKPALMYGHTFCGNPIGAAIAREVLAIYREDGILEGVARKAPRIAAAMDRTGRGNARAIGMIGAVDLGSSGYAGAAGWRVYAEARKRGAYLRPLGDTVYVCPPLTIDDADLDQLLGIFEESIRASG